MKQRLFIAINLKKEVREELLSFQEKYQDLPARWTKPDNLHITAAFIGDVEEKSIPEIHKIIKGIKVKPFEIILKEISYGPPGIIPPRMIWAVGESQHFINLSNELGEKLKLSNKEAIPHITLARIKEWEWRKIEPEERPEVKDFINLKIAVESIRLEKSVLKRTGPEYTVLETYKL